MNVKMILMMATVALGLTLWGTEACQGPDCPNMVKIDLKSLQSWDPNEMRGPSGSGSKRFVKAGAWMDYTIYFENKAEATAAAQEVYVTLPKDPNLDWSTFELGEVSFGSHIDNGLRGKDSGTSSYCLPGSDSQVRTKVTVSDTEVKWYLRNWEPSTVDHFPLDAEAGFLPPNDATHRGEGHLTYRVKVRDDAVRGTMINASATIVFDYNDPIETDPAWWNTVGMPGVAFKDDALTVEEGGSVTLTVEGGSDEKAASAQVCLAYQTAAAADLDLAKATVDGEAVKGGVKFPLTLIWAKGETGAKTIVIPVKSDKTVEDDERLVFQLANVQGMKLGETTECAVTILDGNVAADYAAKQAKTAEKGKKGVETNVVDVACVAGDGSGTVCGYTTGQGRYSKGSKAALKATARPGWEFVGWGEVAGGVTNVVSDKANWSVTLTNDVEIVAVFGRIPYVAGLASPADGGKVSGSGYCAAGKKVTLKATASKNFSFVGWYEGKMRNEELGMRNDALSGEPVSRLASLVLDRSAKPAKPSKTQDVITNVTEDVTYYAVFRSDPEVFVSASATDGKGDALTGKGAGKFVAGTVTGVGKYAKDKKVTLKATANKGYVFTGWQKAGALATKAASYVIEKMPTNDVELVAAFVTTDEDKASIVASVDGMSLTPWVSKAETHAAATSVWAGVYLEWPVAAGALSETTVKVTGLPTGLKFAEKPVTSKVGSGKDAVTVTNVAANTIYGAPTTASKVTTDKKNGVTTVTPSQVKVSVTTAGKNTQTYQVDATVTALPSWVVGTFAGPAYSWETTNGIATVTVAANGKISVKHPVEGRAVSFAASWFDWYDAASEAFVATLTGKDGKEIVSQEMVVGGHAGRVTLPSGSEQVVTNGVIEAALFDAWQYNWRAEPWKSVGKAFDKGTMTYAVENGTVTLKFAASGAVTVVGEFLTGETRNGKPVTVKATGSATLLPVVDAMSGVGYEVFVYLAPKGLPVHARCVVVE